MTTATDIIERPILFSGPMVRAILDGTKTQTRRVVKRHNSTVLGYTAKWAWDQLVWNGLEWVDGPPDPIGGGDGYQYLHVPAWNPADGPVPTPNAKTLDEWEGVMYRVRPRMEPGDRLWVKETWFHCEKHGTHYRADDKNNRWQGKHTWKGPLYMPRWASRILLAVTDVRVQRVQDISEEDAKAEGCKCEPRPQHPIRGTPIKHAWMQEDRDWMAVDVFQELWDSINAKRGYGWDVNPWVWCVSFKRIEK